MELGVPDITQVVLLIAIPVGKVGLEVQLVIVSPPSVSVDGVTLKLLPRLMLVPVELS